jgi:3-deoxy-D-manno-octulosonate 8-phosphate phosphatase (KDO 8-P phosphatase)
VKSLNNQCNHKNIVESFLSKLKEITTLVFDVDGVLTDGSIFVTEDGLQSRAFNIKDGYALQLAVKFGHNRCVHGHPH